MGKLPAGTVTMLFSDIEGSTSLLGRLGDEYGEALSAHRRLLRAAFAAYRGREVSTEGDSFFVVFPSAVDAVGCCVAGQRALAGHDWPRGAAVRVRMGLHSGEPTPHEDNYIGMDVHRAARIAAAAHGGQVVLSDAARLLAEPRLPAGCSLQDLGFHRLKDIEAAERVFQLAGPGLQEQFPLLKSLGAQTSLPVPATPLVGRDGDLERLRAVLQRPGVRLVTLTGTGGVGKTRLALAAAASLGGTFQHGVFFVALAAVRDAGVMWKVIADSLAAGGDEPRVVTGYLAGRQALLVLDNLEQLSGAAEVVAALLAAAPGVVVLATSRRPLHLQGEHELPVPPLQIPAAGAAEDAVEVAASAAARLFVQQAEMVRPGFAVTEDNAPDIAAICRRLDGLPLAIELAASRVRLLAPRALLARLGQSLGLATADRDRPWRQQTLRNLIAWSYDLLDPDVAGAFRRAGVFAGGCDLDALAAVAVTGGGDLAGADPLDLAAGLLDVSLITVTEGADGEPRIGMRVATGVRLVLALAPFWYHRAHSIEGRRWLQRAIELVPGDAGAPLARMAHGLGVMLDEQGEYEAARPFFERSLTIWRELGDRNQQARALNSLGITHRLLGDMDTARSLLQDAAAIAREIGHDVRLADALTNLGQVESQAGNFDRATQALQEALTLDQKHGDVFGVAIAQQSLAFVCLRAGRARDAREPLSRMLENVVSMGSTALVADALEMSAAVIADLGDGLRAAHLAGAAQAVRQEMGTPITQSDAALLERYLAPARAAVAPDAWEAELAAGRALTQPQAVALLTRPRSA